MRGDSFIVCWILVGKAYEGGRGNWALLVGLCVLAHSTTLLLHNSTTLLLKGFGRAIVGKGR